MNTVIRDELILMLNVFEGYEEKDHFKIVATCSKMLKCDKYINLVKKNLDEMCKESSFDITTDFINLVVKIIAINKNVEFYKKLSINKMKICIYCILYHYLINNNDNENLNKLKIEKIRILYYNTVKVLLIDPEALKVNKESLSSKIGRYLDIACLVGNKIFV